MTKIEELKQGLQPIICGVCELVDLCSLEEQDDCEALQDGITNTLKLLSDLGLELVEVNL